MEKQENEIMIYEDKDGVTKVNVKFVNEDIWLTQNQLAEIYETTQQNISQHINSIYEDNELLPDSTNKKFLLVHNITPFFYRGRKPTAFRRWEEPYDKLLAFNLDFRYISV